MAVATHTPENGATQQSWFIPAVTIVCLFVSIIIAWMLPTQTEVAPVLTENFDFISWVNTAEQWLKDNFREQTRWIAGFIKGGLEWLEEYLVLKPWVFILLLFALPALAYGGLRMALLAIVTVCFWGAIDMWFSAMTTLALMGMSVLLSVIFGIMIGVACSQSDGLERVVRPILDAMQTMPSFVYLIPAVFFFGIGGAPAVIATMIYAMPPMIRLTNLGIRQVPDTTMEAARSFGTSRFQTLYKVQLPLALPSIMLGINQTVMMALGLVVLATFIGAGGLGDEVWQAMRQLNVGWSLEGGICIVFMAILFDRLSYAMSGKNAPIALGPNQLRFRLLPQSWDTYAVAVAIERVINAIWDGVAGVCQAIVGAIAKVVSAVVSPLNGGLAASLARTINERAFLIIGVALLYAVLLFDRHVMSIGDFPSDWKFTLRGPVDQAVEWLTVNPTFIGITKGIKAFTYLYLLNPLVTFLTHMPWWYTISAIGLIAIVSSGWRLALASVLCLLFIAAGGIWIFAMETLATIGVCVLVCLLVGVPLGVVAAYNKTLDTFLKPLLDAMQTMPAFVYLVPVLMFFGGGIVAAIIATVIYAMPPVIRLTTLGLQQLPTEIDEVSHSFGSTSLQSLFKVKLPMATPSIMLGLNQSVMMALAVQVITPLIGGRGLGHQVFDAFNVSNSGKGLLAGISIVFVAIILDRLAQAWNSNQRRALGLD